MPRTKAIPAHVPPTDPARVPLSRCGWCAGNSYVPTADGTAEVCPVCEGGSWAPVSFDLGSTHTYPSRSALFNAGTGTLWVWRRNRKTRYVVREFVPDHVDGEVPVRAFAFRKDDGETHHATASRAGFTCDCGGGTFGTSARANHDAYLDGRETFPTLGCVHLDALRILLYAGQLDLPGVMTEPADVVAFGD